MKRKPDFEESRRCGFFYGLFGLHRVRAQAKLLSRINVIWVVQSLVKKYSCFRFTQITLKTFAVSSHRGALRGRHERGTGCGGR